MILVNETSITQYVFCLFSGPDDHVLNADVLSSCSCKKKLKYKKNLNLAFTSYGNLDTCLCNLKVPADIACKINETHKPPPTVHDKVLTKVECKGIEKLCQNKTLGTAYPMKTLAWCTDRVCLVFV